MDEHTKLGNMPGRSFSKIIKEYLERRRASVESSNMLYIDMGHNKWHMVPHYHDLENDVVARNVQDPLGKYNSGSYSYYQESRDSAENQRLKDQLIEKEREIAKNRNDLTDMRQVNDKLLDEIAACRSIDKAQKHFKCAHEQDRVMLSEIHHGVVSRSHGNEVEVTYEVANEEPLLQIYSSDQFSRHKLPTVGTWLETIVIMAKIDYKDIKELYADEPDKLELPNFDDVGIPGGSLNI